MPEFSTKGRTAADPSLHAHTCDYRRTFRAADCTCALSRIAAGLAALFSRQPPQTPEGHDAMATRHAAYIQRQARALLDDQDPNWQDGPLTPSRVTQLERDLAAEREISRLARAEVRRLEAVITELADPGGNRAKFLAAMIRQLDHQLALAAAAMAPTEPAAPAATPDPIHSAIRRSHGDGRPR